MSAGIAVEVAGTSFEIGPLCHTAWSWADPLALVQVIHIRFGANDKEISSAADYVPI